MHEHTHHILITPVSTTPLPKPSLLSTSPATTCHAAPTKILTQRSICRQSAVLACPHPAADASILLTVSDIPRRDCYELQSIPDAFHANQDLQAEGREILHNKAE